MAREKEHAALSALRLPLLLQGRFGCAARSVAGSAENLKTSVSSERSGVRLGRDETGRESLTPLGSQEGKLGKLLENEMLGKLDWGVVLALPMFQLV